MRITMLLTVMVNNMLNTDAKEGIMLFRKKKTKLARQIILKE